MKFPEEFEQAVIDLEIDLGGKGGIQRFKTVADFQVWLNGEDQFWNWIDQAPASSHTNSLGDTIPRFKKMRSDCRAQINNPGKQKWQQLRPSIAEFGSVIADNERSDEEQASAHERKVNSRNPFNINDL